VNSLSREGCAVDQLADPIELGGYRQAFFLWFCLHGHSSVLQNLFDISAPNAAKHSTLLVEHSAKRPKTINLRLRPMAIFQIPVTQLVAKLPAITPR